MPLSLLGRKAISCSWWDQVSFTAERCLQSGTIPWPRCHKSWCRPEPNSPRARLTGLVLWEVKTRNPGVMSRGALGQLSETGEKAEVFWGVWILGGRWSCETWAPCHPPRAVCYDGGPLLWMYASDPGHTQHAYIRGRSQEVGEGKERLVDSLEGKYATQRARVWSRNISRFPGAGP